MDQKYLHNRPCDDAAAENAVLAGVYTPLLQMQLVIKAYLTVAETSLRCLKAQMLKERPENMVRHHCLERIGLVLRIQILRDLEHSEQLVGKHMLQDRIVALDEAVAADLEMQVREAACPIHHACFRTSHYAV